MLGRTDSRGRLILLVIVFGLISGSLALRLAYWQIGQADDLSHRAGEQLSVQPEDQVLRGEILDSRGVLLATTAFRDKLVAYPDVLTADDRLTVATRLAEILELDEGATNDLVAAFRADVPYLTVARRITPAQSNEVREGLASGRLAAVGLEPSPVRFYPNDGGSPGTTLASQLLGFVTDDGQGRYGVEQFGQSLLTGTGDATANAGDAAIGLPSAGGQIALTIDASLQLRLERELYAAWVADRAPRVTGVVMDPYTGAILAWASVPGYDANDYSATAETAPELFTDPIISQIYEPGSVMKLFTAAAAMERGVVDLDTPIADGRVLRIGPDEVRNGDDNSIGVASFADIIAHSRNVGVGRVALSLGPTEDEGAAILYEMWQRLGIGRPTGIELGSESAGIVADPASSPWQTIDLVNRSFGQGVAVTPLQLATAYCAMVNGGRLPVPHVIAGLGGEAVEQPLMQQVMEADLSDELTELMVHVVETGPHYAPETLIEGYMVGGKTGTAQIWDSDAGGWMRDTFNHTFIGFVGADRPEAVILVRIHETKPRVEKSWGMTLEMTSNELFRRVATDVIAALDLQPRGGPTQAPDSTQMPSPSPLAPTSMGPDATLTPQSGRITDRD